MQFPIVENVVSSSLGSIQFNRIYCEDCYDGMKRIPDGSVDLIVTDPPYGTTNCSWDKAINIPAMFEEFLRVCKDNAAIVIFSQLPFAVDLINAQRALFRYEWIWEKTLAVGFLNANKMPLRAHENILVFYRKLPTYNPIKTAGKPYKNSTKSSLFDSIYNTKTQKLPSKSLDGTRFPKSILYFTTAFYEENPITGKAYKKTFHPTCKPLELIKYLIKTYSNEGEIVLDAFAGSGTTACACIETNRQYICFEKESKYVEVANERIKDIITPSSEVQIKTRQEITKPLQLSLFA